MLRFEVPVFLLQIVTYNYAVNKNIKKIELQVHFI